MIEWDESLNCFLFFVFKVSYKFPACVGDIPAEGVKLHKWNKREREQSFYTYRTVQGL